MLPRGVILGTTAMLTYDELVERARLCSYNSQITRRSRRWAMRAEGKGDNAARGFPRAG